MKKTLIALLTMCASVAAAQNVKKISPFLADMISRHDVAAVRKAAPERSVKVLMALTPGADEQAVAADYGARVETRIGRVLVVRVPLYNIGAMSMDDRVERIEAERAPRPMLDRVPRQIGADKAAAGTQLPQAFTGSGVVVGIVDGGFDYVNPFFRDADGEPRILWAADYMADRKYEGKADVKAAMHSSDAATMLHGTHVAGIAAGSEVEEISFDDDPPRYRGIAFEADIAEGAVETLVGDEGLSSASSVQAFSDIFQWAEEQGKPCVINYSMGDAMSFAAGRQLEEEAISTLLAKPGRALVVASGNSGGTARLAHKTADMAEGGAGVWFNDDEPYGHYFGVELKVMPAQTLTLRLTDSTYRTVKAEQTVTVAQLADAATLTVGTTQLRVQQRGQTADGYTVVYIAAGSTTFTTAERMLVTIGGEGEAWIYADALCAQLENVAAYDNHALAEQGYSMTWPAEMADVIAVGNIAHRLKIYTAANKYAQGDSTDLTAYESTKGPGYLARSSSVGPTLQQRVKPDVCAPGVNIISAYNNFVNETTDMQYAGWLIGHIDTDYEPEYGGYFVTLAQTGTSMSAPAVTGTIALWMQADPTLTVDRIRDVIAHSCRQPDAELSYPNNDYGHGEIDAYRGLLYLLGVDAIHGVSHHQPQKATVQLSDRRLTIAYDGIDARLPHVAIYTTGGRLVLARSAASIDLSRLPQGVYVVQVDTGEQLTTGSTLIRL